MINVLNIHRHLWKILLVFALLMMGEGKAQAYDANENYPALPLAAMNRLTATERTVEIPLSGFMGNGVNFARIFVVDRATRQPLYDLTSQFSMISEVQNGNDLLKGLFFQSDYGYVEFTRWAATRYSKNIQFTLPDGKEWSDIFFMAVKKAVGGNSKEEETTNAHNLGIYGNDGFNYNGFMVTSDPRSWDAAAVYTVNYDLKLRFAPYEGVTGKAGDFETNAAGDKRQKCFTWKYDLYVQPGTQVELKAPVDEGNEMEYTAYWRWYDNQTFAASNRIYKNDTHGSKLNEEYVDSKGRSVGLTYQGTNIEKIYYKDLASVVYDVPNDANWKGDVIAADASRYIDWESNLAMVDFREPTLSMRYRFYLHPAKELADTIKGAILKGDAYEDHGNIMLAVQNAESKNAYHSLRLDLRNIQQYWCYPFTKRLWAGEADESDFEMSNMFQAKSFTWAIHINVGDKFYYKIIKREDTDLLTNISIDLKIEDIKGTYKNVLDESDTREETAFNLGSEYIIVAYANNYSEAEMKDEKDQRSSPVARFNCYFVEESQPMPLDAPSTHRALQYLEDKYIKVGDINFDTFDGMNYDEPKQPYIAGRPDNNSYDQPLPWKESYYGFTYPQLKNKSNDSGYKWLGYAPVHGDYVLVKSAKYGNASPDNPGWGAIDNGYKWWYGSANVLHDCTWHETNGARHGHFLYVDAADEARPIASLSFEGEICAGTALIFTGAVANMTLSSSESPQLVLKLYGVKYDDANVATSTQLIQTFSTGDFKSHGIMELGKWYQIFGKTFIAPHTKASEFKHFLVTIVNNCKSTAGADYAIDGIRFYVANNQVEVLQQGDAEDLCEKKNNGAYLKLRVDYSMLRSFIQFSKRDKPLYYRICEENGTPANIAYPKDDGVHQEHTATDASGNTYKYGSVLLHSDETKDAPYLERDVHGYQHYLLADNIYFQLDPTKSYYVSVALPKETYNQATHQYEYEPSEWGNAGNTCTIYSKKINVQHQSYVVTSANGETSAKFFAQCGEVTVDIDLTAQLTVPDAVYGGYKTVPWRFDWLIGGEEKFQKDFVENGTLTALQHFREVYPDANKFDYDVAKALENGDIEVDADGNYYFFNNSPLFIKKYGNTYPQGVFTIEDALKLQTLLNTTVNTPSDDVLLLYVNGSDNLKHRFDMPLSGSVNTHIYYVPIAGIYTDKVNKVNYRICSDPIKGRLVLSYYTPLLYLGFPSVTYPEKWETAAKHVRLGLAQMNEMKAGAVLQIPIKGYRDAELNEGDNRHNIAMEEDDGNNQPLPRCVRLVSTNDPSVPKDKMAVLENRNGLLRYYGGKVGEVTEACGIITPASKTIDIDFSKNSELVTTMDVEGQATTSTVVNEVTFHEGYDYEFVLTYHDATKTIGATTTTICYANSFFTLRIIPEYVTWTGAVPTNTNWNNDLNWRRASKEELFKTVGQNSDGYRDYGTDEPGVQQFPNSEKPDETPQAFVPMKFTKVVINPGTSAPYLGSYKVDKNSGIINDLLNPTFSEGTKDIAFDLMVMPDKNAAGAYECERFYANTCKEVFFRTDRTDLPSGEGQLRNQHYLAYKKAWVDYAMMPNKWNLMSAPLHSVYAGDLYLPAQTGRQETEAFQPVTFKPEKGYSRTGYPVFQRNWNKTESLVITANGDDYNADVPYEEVTDTLVLSQWSHVYNDVTVPYEPGRAFSVCPRLVSESQDKACAVLRLPKDDQAYTYYNENGTASSVVSPVLSRSLAGYLATTRTENDDPQTLNGHFDVLLDDGKHVRNGYFLLGNPYMATLDMSLFFKDNPGLYRKYWFFENGELRALGGEADENSNIGLIGPMRGFFVKSKAGENVQKVTFRASQCTTVFYAEGQTAQPSQKIRLMVRDFDGHQSSATVIAEPGAKNGFVEAEDVETLFDTNIGETTPQLYTMAGQKAATINRTADLQNVPLGVLSPKDDAVTLSVTGAEALSQPLYLYDAVKMETLPLTADSRITLKPNVAGRYFLTSTAVAQLGIQTTLRCYSMTPGTVVAATVPADALTEVAVYDTHGRTVAVYHPETAVYNFQLLPGIYLVTLNSHEVPEGRTFKVLVR